MTLRIKLRLTAILPLLVGVIICYALFISSRQIRSAQQTEEVAQAVIRSILELNILTEDIAQHTDARPRIQWQAKYAFLHHLLDTIASWIKDSQAIADFRFTWLKH